MGVRKFINLFVLLLVYCIPKAQVNLQTGSATFSLPMFNWQDDKSRLNSIVALSYNSGNGLRVNDVASNVGQGWNLVAGGVISRMQVGEPDDQPKHDENISQGEHDLKRYPAGYWYADEPAGKGCPDALRKYPIYEGMNELYTQRQEIAEDKQLDYFSFQFNGKAGMFVLDKYSDENDAANNVYVAASLGDSKMKIRFELDPTLKTTRNIRTTIKSFTIQDVDGLIYRFKTLGLTKVLQSGFCDNNRVQLQTQPTLEDGDVGQQAAFDNGVLVNPYVVSSWYLTEIEDALTHRKILFTYDLNRSSDAFAGADMSYSNSLNHYMIVTYKKSVTKTPALLSVIYPDGHNVAFQYGNVRADFDGDKVLSKVDITYKGRYLSEYQLNTTYFLKNRYGNPVSDYQKSIARLCLKSVTKVGVDLKESSPPYIFDYYMGSSAPDDFVPPPFSYRKDPWGFYNGNNSVDYAGNPIPIDLPFSQLNFQQRQGLCFLNNSIGLDIYLNPKSGYAKNGLLKQIIYPTGGNLTYEYAQNIGTFNGTTTASMIGGVSVSQTSSSDGGFSNGCDNPVVTHYNYVLANGSSSMWGLEKPVNQTLLTNNHYEPEWQSWHYPLFDGHWSLGGECYWHYMYPGILSQQQSISLSNFQNIMNTLAPVLNILSIVSTIADFATVIGGSTGFLAIAAVIIDVICGILTIAFSCGHDYSKDTPNTVYYNFDLNNISPLPAQFRRVEVVENTGTIGKTVQEFSYADDPAPGQGFGLYYPTADLSFPARQRFAPWAYGLPRFTTVYDANGNIIRQTENQYQFQSSFVAIEQKSVGYVQLPTYLVSCKCAVINSTSQRSTDWTNPANYNVSASYKSQPSNNPYSDIDKDGNPIGQEDGNIKVTIYPMYTGRAELATSYDRVYQPGDPTKFVETKTEYTYNSNLNYDVNSIKTTQSNGDYNIKRIKYSSDFYGGIFSTLTQNNIVSLPVASTTLVGKFNSNGLDENLSGNTTEFVQLSNGDIKPFKMLEQRFLQPSSAGGTAFKVTQQFSYDPDGNLIGLKDEGGRAIANIYDYNDKYISASIINADPVADKSAYSSFEVENAATGNWIINGDYHNYNLHSASATGNGNFTLLASGANSLTCNGLNTSKPYILSFWCVNGSVSVTGGATLVKSAPTLNGFTYYEYNIAQGVTGITVINNTAANINIDELRLYPKTARMRTTSYDPLIGKTSECDENNRITYFEYDELARLGFIKNESKNVVKMYEYNNISPSKQNGCPKIYYSKAITEYFTPNCSAGFVGTNVPITIPANKYQSPVSQADADAFAESELLNAGPTTAVQQGGCIPIYYNAGKSVSVMTQNCGYSKIPGYVTYTVPQGRYTSIIDQADVNKKEDDDIKANAQAYANMPGNANCTFTTDAYWIYLENDTVWCQTVGDIPHLFVKETDMNPNSPTYHQKRNKDRGQSQSVCPFTLSSIYGENSTSYDFYFAFENTSSGTQYDIHLPPNQNAPIQQIPPGNYNIRLVSGSGVNALFDLNGTFYYGFPGTGLSNITIDGAFYFNISY